MGPVSPLPENDSQITETPIDKSPIFPKSSSESRTDEGETQIKDDLAEENVKNFLKEIYQVENTDEYQELTEKLEEFVEHLKENGNDVQSFSQIKIDEIYKPFLLKYEKYCSEVALQKLIANRYITKYHQQAWEEDCQFFIKGIVLEYDKEDKQIYYTVEIEKKLKDNITQLKSGKGIIRLDEDDYIVWFRITKDLK